MSTWKIVPFTLVVRDRMRILHLIRKIYEIINDIRTKSLKFGFPHVCLVNLMCLCFSFIFVVVVENRSPHALLFVAIFSIFQSVGCVVRIRSHTTNSFMCLPLRVCFRRFAIQMILYNFQSTLINNRRQSSSKWTKNIKINFN